MAFKMKGQTKALMAIKGISAISLKKLFKFCTQVAHFLVLVVCFLTFKIKGHSSLFEVSHIIHPLPDFAQIWQADQPPLAVCLLPFEIKCEIKFVAAILTFE